MPQDVPHSFAPSVTDRQLSRPPAEGLFLGSAAMLPIVAGATAAALSTGALRAVFLHLLVVWSGAILAFLAGVRRGLSFDERGGARWREIATMLWLFAAAALALVVPAPMVALAALAVGYASLGLFDPRAALVGEAPRFFTALRPVQAAVAVASFVVLQIVLARS